MKKIIGFIICTLLIATTGFSVAEIDVNKDEFIENSSTSNLEHPKPLNQIDEWPMFMYCANHSSYTTSKGPLNDNILWFTNLGEITGSPAVANGKVFLPHWPHSYETSSISCFDAFTGKRLWCFNDITGALPDSAVPAYWKDRVYFQSMADFFYCLDADTGEIIWIYNATSWYSSPTVVNGSVYFCSYNSTVCLNASSGSIKWTYRTYEPDDFFEGCTPAVVNNRVFVGNALPCSRGGALVICLDADRGKEIWTFDMDAQWANSATVVDGKVYIGSSEYLFCLKSQSGSEIWKYPMRTLASPAVAYNRVYIGANGWIYCFDANNGSVLWKFSTGATLNEITSPAISDEMVYITIRENGSICCLDAFTGDIIWSKKICSYNIESSPALAYNNLYTGSFYSDTLYAFGSNDPPYIPIINGPAEGVVNVEYEFSFEAADPDGNDIYYYIIWGDGGVEEWIGPYESGEEVKVNHTWTSVGDFNIKAKAKDIYDSESNWSEASTIHITTLPPDAPSIDGPSSGKKGVSYNFTFNSVDPDGDDIYYYIKWGDGTEEEWDGPHTSGVDFKISHTYKKQRTFTIEAKAKDASGAESNWSYFDIEIPRTRATFNPLFHWFLERFPLLERLLNLLR